MSDETKQETIKLEEGEPTFEEYLEESTRMFQRHPVYLCLRAAVSIIRRFLAMQRAMLDLLKMKDLIDDEDMDLWPKLTKDADANVVREFTKQIIRGVAIGELAPLIGEHVEPDTMSAFLTDIVFSDHEMTTQDMLTVASFMGDDMHKNYLETIQAIRHAKEAQKAKDDFRKNLAEMMSKRSESSSPAVQSVQGRYEALQAHIAERRRRGLPPLPMSETEQILKGQAPIPELPEGV